MEDKALNKNELAEAVAAKTGMTKADSAGAIDAVFESVAKELSGGGEVRLVGFGNFSVVHRAARKGKNPMTGATIDIKASNQPKFKAGKALKEAVN